MCQPSFSSLVLAVSPQHSEHFRLSVFPEENLRNLEILGTEDRSSRDRTQHEERSEIRPVLCRVLGEKIRITSLLLPSFPFPSLPCVTFPAPLLFPSFPLW